MRIIGKIWNRVLEDVEARHVFTKNIMWRTTDFLRHVAGETEGRGTITFTYVCEHRKVIPVEGRTFLLWVSINY